MLSVAAAFEDFGEHSVKNIDKPIGVYRVSSEPISVDATSTASAVVKLFERPAVAVLPFENIGGDPEQDYFADGLTRPTCRGGRSSTRWIADAPRQGGNT